MSKYENSVFPYPVHSTVNLCVWRSKDSNDTSIPFVCLFTETITLEKIAFFQNYKTNVVKIDEIREELSTFYFMT